MINPHQAKKIRIRDGGPKRRDAIVYRYHGTQGSDATAVLMLAGLRLHVTAGIDGQPDAKAWVLRDGSTPVASFSVENEAFEAMATIDRAVRQSVVPPARSAGMFIIGAFVAVVAVTMIGFAIQAKSYRPPYAAASGNVALPLMPTEAPPPRPPAPARSDPLAWMK